MKTVILAFLTIFSLSSLSAQKTAVSKEAARTAQQQMSALAQIDVESSEIEWAAQKVTGAHEGNINLKSGRLIYDSNMLTGGQFVIDMNSINVTDLEGEYKGKLEGHLKSADFFGVEDFPEAKFVINKVISRGLPGQYKVVGTATIKGISKEVRFNAATDESGALTANITLDRTDFDVRYGSGSFFDNLGDKTIYDEFQLDITLQKK